MPKKPTPVTPATDKEILRATSLEPAGIREEYATVSSDLAYWGAVRAEAGRQEKMAALELEIWLSTFVNDERQKAEARGERVPGVDGLERTARAQPRYRELVLLEIEAAKAKDDATAVVSAISAKKEMLVSLGADLRLDAEREIYIKKRPTT